MTKENTGSNNEPKDKAKADNLDFQIIDPNSVEFATRGRKSMADPELIKSLKGLTKGMAMLIPSMAVNPNAETFKTDKARISNRIRTACEKANLTNWNIQFTVDGIPTVILK